MTCLWENLELYHFRTFFPYLTELPTCPNTPVRSNTTLYLSVNRLTFLLFIKYDFDRYVFWPLASVASVLSSLNCSDFINVMENAMFFFLNIAALFKL